MPFEVTPEELVKAFEGYFYWQGIPTLLGCEQERDPTKAGIALVGLPWTSNQIERTQYLGPRRSGIALKIRSPLGGA
jgi:hypothetical protein